MKNLINRLNKIIVNVYSGQNNENTVKQLEQLKLMIKKKENRGGPRAGAGAPLKYGEPLVHITARVPKSKSKFVKGLIKEQLNQWVVRK